MFCQRLSRGSFLKAGSSGRMLPAVIVTLSALVPSPNSAQTVSSRVPVRSFEEFRDSVLEADSLFPTPERVDSLHEQYAQLVADSEEEKTTPLWFGQAGIRTSGGASPTLSLQVYTFWLSVSDSLDLPFWVLSGLPTTAQSDPETVSDEILNEYGGTLNLAAGYTGRPIPPSSPILGFPADEPWGLELTLRSGLKLTDVANLASEGADDPEFVAFLYSMASAKLLLPIWNDDGGVANRNSRAGSLQAELTTAMQWASNSQYRRIFSEQELLPKDLIYVKGNFALILTDFLYLAASVNLHVSEERLEKRTSFSVNYLR